MSEKHILEALNNVMKKVGYVQKTGEMKSGPRFSYASEADLLQALRPAFVEEGIVVAPSNVTLLVDTSYKDSKGENVNRIVLSVDYTFYSSTDTTSITVSSAGEGTDKGDKAAYKAMTGALKYALRQATMVETGNDPDDTSSEEFERETPQHTANNNRPAPVDQAPTAPKTDYVKLYGMNPQEALEVVVPEDLEVPLKGTLGEIIKDIQAGPLVLNYLAGVWPNFANEMFDPGKDHTQLANAAKLLAEHSQVFAETRGEFIRNNPEWGNK